MRNLKRALSLALASVMLLGMMVVGTSAASYTDVSAEDNVEAIEVLNAVEVMIGRQGNFEPDESVNRHEMAVIMAKLVLGVDTADNYVGTHPFTDVVPWADKYVAACYENGLIAGTSATTYGGSQPLTAVQAAAMMLRALGYKNLSKGATDWRAPVTAMANQIRLFSGVASNPSEQLDRNQVAQLTLNTLKSPVVDLKDGTFDITSGDGQIVISGGSREYIVRSSRESYAYAINETESSGNSASGINGATVELGEHLYNGKLELNDDSDAFQRPARQWVYDGKEIGVYAKDELLRREYTTEVTGRDLYNQLGSSIVNNIGTGSDDWTLLSYVDGEDGDLEKAKVARSYTDGVLETGKGVLTQVFVDSAEKEVRVVVINTFLVIADEDYDEKNGEVDLTVYAMTNLNTSRNPVYYKDKDVNGIPVTVEDEDIDVSAVKEDDMYLVTVADGRVQSMVKPEVLSDREISSFKKTSDVVSDGKTYEYGDTAKYDVEVLEQYSNTNMKDTTYNIVLDKYGYMIGLEQNSEPDQYVFLVGLDGNYSWLTNKDTDASIIRLDGTMETVTVNVKKSAPMVDGALEEGGDWTNGNGTARDASQLNTWCTYSVNSAGVYTLKEVADEFPAKGTKVAQAMQDAGNGSGGVKIDKKNVSLDNADASGKVYGNDDTVYINVSLAALKTAESSNPWFQVIDDVESRTVGAKNASLKVAGLANGTGTYDGSDKDKATYPTNEIYTLYKSNGYIIAAVVVGEDDGLSKTYAYIHSDDVKRETYDKANDEWTWVREAIVDGKVVDLREVGGGTELSYLDDVLEQNNWYEIKTNADGNVTDAKLIKLDTASGAAPENPPHSNTSAGAALAKDYVFCIDYTNHIGSGDYPKFIGLVEMVDDSIADNDSVILFQKGFTVPEDATDDTIEYKNGTLYVNTDDIKGFDVSPDVKTVLCLSDGEGGAFDSVTDTYTGYAGLERAIKNLDSNFTGDLSVVFEKGSAVVIIFNDTTEATDEGDDGDETGVEIKSFDPYTGDVEIYGASSVTPAQFISYLKSKGYTNVKYNSKESTISCTTPDGNDVVDIEVNPIQVFKVSLSKTDKTAKAKGVTFTISNFADQYVNATDGYTIEVVVTGALEGTDAATGTVAATTTGTAATLGEPAEKEGTTASANFGTHADGAIVTGTTDKGATTGTFTIKVSGMDKDCVISISAS